MTLGQLQRAAIAANMNIQAYALYLLQNALTGESGFSTLVSVSEEILNTITKTNNLVSVIEFAYTDGSDTAFTKYNAWITANPDWHIISEITYPNPDLDETLNGTPVIMVRYSGEKISE